MGESVRGGLNDDWLWKTPRSLASLVINRSLKSGALR